MKISDEGIISTCGYLKFLPFKC